MTGRLVVVKVGGSLLDWPGLAGGLSAYLESRRSDRVVLVVGGGRFADVLRDLDRSLTLGEERSHALALRVLDLTARLLGEILPGSFVIEDLPKLEDAWSRQQAPILVPRRFMDDEIPEGLKIADAARLGLVDPEFPRAVVSVPVVTIQSLIARENHSS
jgi:aspartokinase-like uncharacterized kinase